MLCHIIIFQDFSFVLSMLVVAFSMADVLFPAQKVYYHNLFKASDWQEKQSQKYRKHFRHLSAGNFNLYTFVF